MLRTRPRPGSRSVVDALDVGRAAAMPGFPPLVNDATAIASYVHAAYCAGDD